MMAEFANDYFLRPEQDCKFGLFQEVAARSFAPCRISRVLNLAFIVYLGDKSVHKWCDVYYYEGTS